MKVYDFNTIEDQNLKRESFQRFLTFFNFDTLIDIKMSSYVPLHSLTYLIKFEDHIFSALPFNFYHYNNFYKNKVYELVNSTLLDISDLSRLSYMDMSDTLDIAIFNNIENLDKMDYVDLIGFKGSRLNKLSGCSNIFLTYGSLFKIEDPVYIEPGLERNNVYDISDNITENNPVNTMDFTYLMSLMIDTNFLSGYRPSEWGQRIIDNNAASLFINSNWISSNDISVKLFKNFRRNKMEKDYKVSGLHSVIYGENMNYYLENFSRDSILALYPTSMDNQDHSTHLEAILTE